MKDLIICTVYLILDIFFAGCFYKPPTVKENNLMFKPQNLTNRISGA